MERYHKDFEALERKRKFSLFSQGENLQFIGFMDANWLGDLEGKKSTLEYAFSLNEGAIS